MSDDTEALDDDERQERTDELLARILETERTEAAIMDASGLMDYRADMDPRACLGLSSDLPPPVR